MNTVPRVLDLFPEAPAPLVQPRVRKRVARKPADNGSPAAAAMQPSSLEDMARQLEASPDYRVLRRLQPRPDWGDGAGAPVRRVIVLDTETTGLDQNREQIIELAMLRVDVNMQTGLPVGCVQVYDGLQDPGKPIPAEVVALTGIRDADVQGQQLDEGRVLSMLDGVDLVIAHNAGFDRPFVERRMPVFADLPWACSFADIDWKAQGRASAKLESLAQANGWFYDAHRAEMDCHALLAVLAQPLATGEGTGLLHLIQSVAQASYSLQANYAPFEEKDKLKARGYRWNAEQRVWQTRVRSADLLREECDWLKTEVYGNRAATVHVEMLDASVKYSARPGKIMQQTL